jgi:hypothetical protein
MAEMRTRVARIISQMVADDRPSNEIADAIFDELREPTKYMLDKAVRHMDSYSSNLEWWNAMLAAAKFEEPKSAVDQATVVLYNCLKKTPRDMLVPSELINALDFHGLAIVKK